MNGVFNTGLNYWQSIGVIFSVAISAIAIKITFNFDLNKYLERKDEKNLAKLRNHCPHVEMTPTEDGRLQIRSMFESPAGTLQWQCQKCGLIRNHDNDYQERYEYYVKNPKEYLKKNKKFQKLIKKNGMI